MSIKIEELNIEVEDVADFNEKADDIMSDFVTDINSNPANSNLPKDDDERAFCEEHGCTHIYTDESIAAIVAEHERLIVIGKKYFDERDLYIDCPVEY